MTWHEQKGGKVTLMSGDGAAQAATLIAAAAGADQQNPIDEFVCKISQNIFRNLQSAPPVHHVRCH